MCKNFYSKTLRGVRHRLARAKINYILALARENHDINHYCAWYNVRIIFFWIDTDGHRGRH